ncbi:MAG: hypothetical protein J3K34DRAFT_521491 [Monoraphidium minutum]|nr:MAG: hypothetical protein J3K34DRAFT_521491 [Monoraphidium minutum]
MPRRLPPRCAPAPALPPRPASRTRSNCTCTYMPLGFLGAPPRPLSQLKCSQVPARLLLLGHISARARACARPHCWSVVNFAAPRSRCELAPGLLSPGRCSHPCIAAPLCG